MATPSPAAFALLLPRSTVVEPLPSRRVTGIPLASQATMEEMTSVMTDQMRSSWVFTMA
jgi:hypothetical protein